jgi:putative tricarboxylic transport membrane protein
VTEGSIVNRRRPNRAALIIAAVLAAVGMVLIWQGFSIPDKGGYAGVGSGGLPKFIGGGLLVLALGHVVTARQPGGSDGPVTELVPVLWIIAGLVLQLILLHPLGFSIASGLLFALTAAGFGKRRVTVTLPIGIALSLVIFGVFDQLLKLNLPAGPLERLIFGG